MSRGARRRDAQDGRRAARGGGGSHEGLDAPDLLGGGVDVVEVPAGVKGDAHEGAVGEPGVEVVDEGAVGAVEAEDAAAGAVPSRGGANRWVSRRSGVGGKN